MVYQIVEIPLNSVSICQCKLFHICLCYTDYLVLALTYTGVESDKSHYSSIVSGIANITNEHCLEVNYKTFVPVTLTKHSISMNITVEEILLSDEIMSVHSAWKRYVYLKGL